MTATNHTEHYELSQYTEDDRPTYTGDYNGDMSKIDAAIYAASQAGGGLTTVAHDDTLTGDGTSDTPLSVAAGTAIKPVDNRWNNIDFNDFYTNGIYTFNGTPTNGPRARRSSGAFIVLRAYQTVVQIYSASPYDSNTKMAVRYATTPDAETNPTAENWSAWVDIASKNDIPDVSELTSRIATLESQVAALTATAAPSVTGLTAEQLDTQYSDNYNIVRVETPTHSSESEESSQG